MSSKPEIPFFSHAVKTSYTPIADIEMLKMLEYFKMGNGLKRVSK